MANERDEKHGSGAAVANLVVALFCHVVLGLPWLAAVTGIASLFGDSTALLWGLSGFALWAIGLVDAVRRMERPAATWGAVLTAWLWLLGGPLSLAIVGIQRLPGRKSSEPPRVPPVSGHEDEPVNPELARRLDEVERRLLELGREVAAIRALAETGEAGTAVVAAPPAPARASDWEPRVPLSQPSTPVAPPPPAAPPPPPSKPREPSWWQREMDWAYLLGARGLAWAGGAVTVLGVVFFFVLAVDRGWVGPAERVGLGALASALLFAGGLYLHHRYGSLYSAYAAVGAGLAGAYATLLAAAALYGLVSDLAALAIAAGIAAIGLATSLRWSSEFVAGVGLVGAALVPLMVLFEEDISPLGTGFAGLVFGAIAVVAVLKRWPTLAALGLVATLPQIALLVEDGSATDWDRVLLAWTFSVLYVLTAIGLHRVVDDNVLGGLPATFTILAAVLAAATGFALFEGEERGWVVVGAGAAFLGLAAAFFRDRDFSALQAAIGLGLVGLGLAVVLSGPSLALAWAAEAAVLAMLASRISESRYQLAALAYLAAAGIHALVIDAPPTDLYEAVSDPADGALAPLGVAIAAAVVAFYSRPWPDVRVGGIFLLFEPVLAPFRAAHATWRSLAGWLSGAAALYAASLGVLEAAQAVWPDDSELAFDRGHVGVTALWGLTAAALTFGSRYFGGGQVRAAGLTLAAVTFVQAAVFDVSLAEGPRGWAFLAAAAALLLTALAEELPAAEDQPELSVFAFLLVPVSAALGIFGVYFVADAEGYAWLGLAGVFAALSGLVFRSHRDFSTLLWTTALAIGALAAADLLDGTWLVLALSAAAATVSVVGDRVGEERLQLGAAGYLALAFGYTLVELAPLGEFFTANEDPAAGVPALLCALGAVVVLTVFGLRDERLAEYRPYAAAGTAVLALYAVSLAILGGFEWAGTAVETDFQRGHSAVSAFWGIVGLMALYVGLTRERRAIRLAGFALFGIALAKLFLYDLANLSSITRALSFLAVGAVLLLGGFFYQRLAATTREA